MFVLVDDTGFNDVGYNENNSSAPTPRGLLTPRIDALAAEGVTLTRYYAQEMCTPTRAAIMTGRYPFRYGMTTYTISADAPWGIPLEEPFFPVELQELGYRTFMSGKWHLGAFRPQHLPQFRGFDEASGLQNAQADHWTHVIDGAFDWHALSAEGFWETRFEANGTYAGRLVLDATLAFVRREAARPAETARPWFAYAAFTEAHSPYEAPPDYLALYPHLADATDGSATSRQHIAGMISHNDFAVGELADELHNDATGNWVLVFSSDNGAPGGAGVPSSARPSRWDDGRTERNWPLRGQKHELFEGGVRVAAFVHSPLLPAERRGAKLDALVHAVDWAVTLLSLAGAVEAKSAKPRDGVDAWECIATGAGCARAGLVVNINAVCDDWRNESLGPSDYSTEVPAPKAGLIEGRLKLLAECLVVGDAPKLVGKTMLFDVFADPSEASDLADERPADVARLAASLLEFASGVAPSYVDRPPWQGRDSEDFDFYVCANCTRGRPTGKAGFESWEPWCFTPPGTPC